MIIHTLGNTLRTVAENVQRIERQKYVEETNPQRAEIRQWFYTIWREDNLKDKLTLAASQGKFHYKLFNDTPSGFSPDLFREEGKEYFAIHGLRFSQIYTCSTHSFYYELDWSSDVS